MSASQPSIFPRSWAKQPNNATAWPQWPPRDLTDRVRSAVRGVDDSAKGVRVTQEEGRLVIELHIAVSYGLNISTAARSISHRVKDEVEQATGLKVARVVVSVDDVVA